MVSYYACEFKRSLGNYLIYINGGHTLSLRQEQQVIIESYNLVRQFGFTYGQISYLFQAANDGVQHSFSAGTYGIEDGVGLISIQAGNQVNYALPIGTYNVDATAIIKVSATGHGDTFSFGSITGTTPDLSGSQLANNPNIFRSFTEYSIGSNDYVRTSLQFDLEVTNPQGLLAANYANVVDEVSFMEIVFTKID